MRVYQQALLCLTLVTILGISGCNSIPSKERAQVPAEPVAANLEIAPESAPNEIKDKLSAEQKFAEPTPPTDLWQRIRNGYGMQLRNNARIEREVQ